MCVAFVYFLFNDKFIIFAAIEPDLEDGYLDVMPESSVCVLCERRFRKVRRLNQSVTKTTLDSKKEHLLQILRAMGKQDKVDELGTVQSMSYHTTCLSDLAYKYFKQRSLQRNTSTEGQSEWANKRDIHSATFSKMKQNIVETLIDNNEVRALSDIYDIYKAI